MNRRLIRLLAVGLVIAGTRAGAHHQFRATYVEGREMTIEGDLIQFLYRNPHSFVQILARDSTNQPERWSVEWDGRGLLDQQGITSMTLKPGDHLIITGVPGPKQNDHWLRLRSMVRPRDGWHWMGKMD